MEREAGGRPPRPPRPATPEAANLPQVCVERLEKVRAQQQAAVGGADFWLTLITYGYYFN